MQLRITKYLHIFRQNTGIKTTPHYIILYFPKKIKVKCQKIDI